VIVIASGVGAWAVVRRATRPLAELRQTAHRLGSGDLTWPERYNARPEAHAISLVAIADAGFVPGCPPASPPRTLVQQNSRVSAAWRRAMARAEGCRARIEPAAGPEW